MRKLLMLFVACLGAVAVGYGQGNVFLGTDAGMNNSGDYNTFLGDYAGSSNTYGDRNAFLGFAAGSKNTHGDRNTYVGPYAGYYNSTGGDNVFIGTYAGYHSTGANNVYLGFEAGYNETGSNRLHIANSRNNTLIYGQFDNKRVGINTTSPNYTLHVNGDMCANNSIRSSIFYDSNNTSYYVDPASTSVLNTVRGGIFYDSNNTSYYVDPASTSVLNTVRGGIFYDKDNTSYYVDPASNSKLSIITAERVNLAVGSFPDYVFEDNYKLMPLEKVEAYIKKHKHLPNVPAAAQVTKEGMNVGQINVLLMEKVEELTLHTIAQQKQIKALQQGLAAMKKALKANK